MQLRGSAEQSMPVSLLLTNGIGANIGSDDSSQGQLLHHLSISPPYMFPSDSQGHANYLPQVCACLSITKECAGVQGS